MRLITTTSDSMTAKAEAINLRDTGIYPQDALL